MNTSGCDFCRNADFRRFSTWVEKFSDGLHAGVSLAGGSSEYRRDEQFNFCPVCGNKLKGDASMGIGQAIEALKAGKLVRRRGWNGEGMYLALVKGGGYEVYLELPFNSGTEREVPRHTLLPWIGMKTADDRFVPWIASQTDILAEDWEWAE